MVDVDRAECFAEGVLAVADDGLALLESGAALGGDVEVDDPPVGRSRCPGHQTAAFQADEQRGDDVRDLDRRQVDAQATALLPRGGILASTTPPADPDALARGGITTVPVMRRPDHADLHRLAALLTAGRVVAPQVDHRPLDRARQALADIHAGATPAKLVLITT